MIGADEIICYTVCCLGDIIDTDRHIKPFKHCHSQGINTIKVPKWIYPASTINEEEEDEKEEEEWI